MLSILFFQIREYRVFLTFFELKTEKICWRECSIYLLKSTKLLTTEEKILCWFLCIPSFFLTIGIIYWRGFSIIYWREMIFLTTEKKNLFWEEWCSYLLQRMWRWHVVPHHKYKNSCRGLKTLTATSTIISSPGLDSLLQFNFILQSMKLNLTKSHVLPTEADISVNFRKNLTPHVHVSHESFVCVTWLILTRNMTHAYMRH